MGSVMSIAPLGTGMIRHRTFPEAGMKASRFLAIRLSVVGLTTVSRGCSEKISAFTRNALSD